VSRLAGAVLALLALAAPACEAPESAGPEPPTAGSARLLAEARAREDEGRPAEALALYETALAAQPRLAEARVRAADLSRRAGDLPAAARHVRRALELAPERADTQLAAAGIALARDDRSTAVSHLRRALEIGRAFSQAGFHPDAVESVRAALAAGGPSPEARYALAWTLEQAGRYDECVREYFALLEDHPDHLPAYRNLGALMARDGELPRAIELWERGLRHHPDDAGLRANVDEALDALGLRRSEAAE
jgi:tetratricopeptide (TPR) repeat protein